MKIAALAVAAFGTVVMIGMVRTGSASVDGESLRRDEEPEIYWSIFVAAVAILVLLLGVGFEFW